MLDHPSWLLLALIFSSVATCSNITVRFDSPNNYFNATNVVVASDTFLKGRLYETYQGPYVLLNEEGFQISSSVEAFSGNYTWGDDVPLKILGNSSDIYIRRIVVDLHSCILATFNESLNSVGDENDKIVKGTVANIESWSWRSLSSRIGISSWTAQIVSRLSDFVIGPVSLCSFKLDENWGQDLRYSSSVSAGRKECVWTSQPIGNGMFMTFDAYTGDFWKWAEANLSKEGHVSGAITLGIASNDNITSCVQFCRNGKPCFDFRRCPSDWVYRPNIVREKPLSLSEIFSDGTLPSDAIFIFKD